MGAIMRIPVTALSWRTLEAAANVSGFSLLVTPNSGVTIFEGRTEIATITVGNSLADEDADRLLRQLLERAIGALDGVPT